MSIYSSSHDNSELRRTSDSCDVNLRIKLVKIIIIFFFVFSSISLVNCFSQLPITDCKFAF